MPGPNEATEIPRDDEEKADGEEVVSLLAYAQEQLELDEEAEAVYGDASDERCSYELGYYRQALFACLTCTPGPLDSHQVAGMCLACSLHCHADHEVVELYTKRDFRCDCGNSRFPTPSPCTLWTDKDLLNDRNVYSHNFVGTFCTCHSAQTTDGLMIQCVVCEDWLHENHIFGDSRPIPDAFDEFICHNCMIKHPFLAAYQLLEQDDDTNVVSSACVLETLQKRLATQDQGQTTVEPTFWSFAWRSRLCGCTKCIVRMEKANITFLMDPDDSLQAYEERTKQHERELQAHVPTVPHEIQIEMAAAYNHMKEKLTSFLRTAAASGKTVRSEDVQDFAEELHASWRASKRPRHD